MSPQSYDDEVPGMDADQARRYVQARLAELPYRPEDAEVRLRGLLAIYEELNARGYPEPMILLAGVLGIPVDILIRHLRAAQR
ncbi:hypothetical protein GCM10009541_08310 [Micromonospora gifhornensis]|uniref:Uncharacterized protein n=1 Tax=Micromonospora gifhornensis TaxID=84594 RepID=A0ABQ4IMW9_9ACTN|nr:hypothetical protein [Micromonospora gifhornensis]GIJ19259.1 hypothetical protein Vgi01_59430 [Micromonospora gifhornensis]